MPLGLATQRLAPFSIFGSWALAGSKKTARPAFMCTSCRLHHQKEDIMKFTRAIAFAVVTGATLVAATGCSVFRDQQSVGSYMDDAGITTAVKAKMAEDKSVAATSISVETLNGTVQLSGFAKTQAEKNRAEQIARSTNNVREVRNSIVVRP